MNPVQYILIDRTVHMSPGKLAAQASHAAVEGYRLSDPSSPEVRAWLRSKQYAKVVLEVADLQTALTYITSRGFKAELIIDEGRTEFGGTLTPTAVGCAIVDKDWAKVKEVFGVFDLYGTHDQKAVRAATRGAWQQGTVPSAQLTASTEALVEEPRPRFIFDGPADDDF